MSNKNSSSKTDSLVTRVHNLANNKYVERFEFVNYQTYLAHAALNMNKICEEPQASISTLVKNTHTYHPLTPEQFVKHVLREEKGFARTTQEALDSLYKQQIHTRLWGHAVHRLQRQEPSTQNPQALKQTHQALSERLIAYRLLMSVNDNALRETRNVTSKSTKRVREALEAFYTKIGVFCYEEADKTQQLIHSVQALATNPLSGYDPQALAQTATSYVLKMSQTTSN